MSSPQLSREARTLIEAAGTADDPSPEELRRTRQRVLARVGVAAGAGAATLLASKGAAASASTATGFAFWKVGLALVVLGAGGGAAAVAMREPARAVASQPSEPRAEAKGVAPAVVSGEAPRPDERAAEPERKAATKAPPAAKGPLAPARSADDLDRELKQVGKAEAALREGKGADALAMLGPEASGALAEERAAARVFALCQLGREIEAKGAAQAFLAKYPRSPQAPRVRTSCGGK